MISEQGISVLIIVSPYFSDPVTEGKNEFVKSYYKTTDHGVRPYVCKELSLSMLRILLYIQYSWFRYIHMNCGKKTNK